MTSRYLLGDGCECGTCDSIIWRNIRSYRNPKIISCWKVSYKFISSCCYSISFGRSMSMWIMDVRKSSSEAIDSLVKNVFVTTWQGWRHCLIVIAIKSVITIVFRNAYSLDFGRRSEEQCWFTLVECPLLLSWMSHFACIASYMVSLHGWLGALIWHVGMKPKCCDFFSGGNKGICEQPDFFNA